MIAAASIRDGRPPDERLTLPLSEVRQSRADVSYSAVQLSIYCTGLRPWGLLLLLLLCASCDIGESVVVVFDFSTYCLLCAWLDVCLV